MATLFSCSDDKDDNGIAIQYSVSLSNQEITVGETIQLNYQINPVGNPDNTVWTILSGEEYVTLTNNGVITGINPGKAVIEVSLHFNNNQSSSAKCEVTILPVATTGIILSSNSIDLLPNESLDLTYSVIPEDAKDYEIKWENDNPSIVSIENIESGIKITALAPGQAVITASISGTDQSATCIVNVSIILPEEIILSSNSLDLLLNETGHLTYKVIPEDATDYKVKWDNDPSVAGIEVLDDGVKVLPITVGSTTIKVSIVGMDISSSCVVNISYNEIESFSLNKNSVTLEQGESEQLNVIILPSTANQEVVWKSSDESIATVKNGKITAKKEGDCTITVTSIDGNFEDKCDVTVLPISVKGISITGTYTPLVGEAFYLQYKITPTNAANQQVTFSSSDPSIIYCNSDGLCNAVAKGTAIVTVTTEDGGYSDSIEITVLDITAFISLSLGSGSMTNIGGYVTFVGSVNMKNTSNSAVTLSKLKIKDGSGNIKQTYDLQSYVLNGNSSASCDVSFSQVYNPIGVLTFEYKGEEYSVEKELSYSF